MIYVPELESDNCVVIRSADVIRVYDYTPTLNSEVHYKDYYPSLDYNYNEGYQTFGNYSNSLPICKEATSDVEYSPSYQSTLLIVLVLVVGGVAFLYKILDDIF